MRLSLIKIFNGNIARVWTKITKHLTNETSVNGYGDWTETTMITHLLRDSREVSGTYSQVCEHVFTKPNQGDFCTWQEHQVMTRMCKKVTACSFPQSKLSFYFPSPETQKL